MKPHIILSTLDVERLEALLDSQPETLPGAQALFDELGRAEVREPDEMPPSIVTMNSTVRFLIGSSNEEHCLTLVYPKDVKDNATTISVLSPVGSALLGMAAGNSIEWPGPDGRLLTVRILDVVHQPERAGDLHR